MLNNFVIGLLNGASITIGVAAICSVAIPPAGIILGAIGGAVLSLGSRK